MGFEEEDMARVYLAIEWARKQVVVTPMKWRCRSIEGRSTTLSEAKKDLERCSYRGDQSPIRAPGPTVLP